jgi:hypothetical protein
MIPKKQSWLDVKRCMNCGSSKWKKGYADYMDGHTLLECETLCANCGKSIYVFAYGNEEHYTFTFRELLKTLAL